MGSSGASKNYASTGSFGSMLARGKSDQGLETVTVDVRGHRIGSLIGSFRELLLKSEGFSRGSVNSRRRIPWWNV